MWILLVLHMKYFLTYFVRFVLCEKKVLIFSLYTKYNCGGVSLFGCRTYFVLYAAYADFICTVHCVVAAFDNVQFFMLLIV